MTRTEAIQRISTAMDVLTLIDTLTRSRTGQRYTQADIVDAKRTLRMHMQLIEAGAHDVAFEKPLTVADMIQTSRNIAGSNTPVTQICKDAGMI